MYCQPSTMPGFLALALLALDQGDLRFFRYNLVRLLPSGVYLVGLLALWALDVASVAALVWASWLGTALTALLRLYQSRGASSPAGAVRGAPAAGLRRPPPRRRAARGSARRGRPLRRRDLLGRCQPRPVRRGDDASDRRTEPGHRRLQRRASAAPRPGQRRRGAKANTSARPWLVSLLLSVGTAVLLVVCPWLLPFLFGDVYAGGALCSCSSWRICRWRCARSSSTGSAAPATGARAFWRKVLALDDLRRARLAAPPAPLGLLGIPTALLVADVVSLAYLLAFLRRRLQLSVPECWGLSAATLRRVWCHGCALLNGARAVRAHGSFAFHRRPDRRPTCVCGTRDPR